MKLQTRKKRKKKKKQNQITKKKNANIDKTKLRAQKIFQAEVI